MFRRSFLSAEEFRMCSNVHGVSYIRGSSSSSSESMDELDENYYMNRPPSIFNNNRPINLTIPTNALFPNTVPPASENVPIDSYSTSELYSSVLKEMPFNTDGMQDQDEQQRVDKPEAQALQAEAMSKSKKKRQRKKNTTIQEYSPKENIASPENVLTDNWKLLKTRTSRMQKGAENEGTLEAKTMFSVLQGNSTDEEYEEEVEPEDSGDEEGQHRNSATKETTKKKRKKKRNRKRAVEKKAVATAKVVSNTEPNMERRNILKQKMKDLKKQQSMTSGTLVYKKERCPNLQQELPAFTVDDYMRTKAIVNLFGKTELEKMLSMGNVMESQEDLQKMISLARNLAKKTRKINKKVEKRQKSIPQLPILLYELPMTSTRNDNSDKLHYYTCLRRENIYNPYYFDTKLTVCDVHHY